MRLWVAVALSCALMAGCVSPAPEAACDGNAAGAPALLRTPMVDGSFLRTDAGTTWDTVVLRNGTGDPLVPSAGPAGWTVTNEDVAGDGDGLFSILRVSPGHGAGKLDLPYDLTQCGQRAKGTLSWDLMAPAAGRSAAPGQGVHVYTAGFWENGTLFYTNIKAIDHADWPRAGWYSWEGADPLPVYVYDRSRGEEPMAWQDPQAGTPAEGTVPGLGYYTTIPGFNEALKGLSTGTVRVVRLTPEQGYTRAGNEHHPLYGDPLVFYIKVVDVVDLPCPPPAARTCGALSSPSPQAGDGSDASQSL